VEGPNNGIPRSNLVVARRKQRKRRSRRRTRATRKRRRRGNLRERRTEPLPRTDDVELITSFSLLRGVIPRLPWAWYDSAYNIWMKTELPRVKEEDPGLDHKEAFAKAASNVRFRPWTNSGEQDADVLSIHILFSSGRTAPTTRTAERRPSSRSERDCFGNVACRARLTLLVVCRRRRRDHVIWMLMLLARC
jgi:hypothetical protein